MFTIVLISCLYTCLASILCDIVASTNIQSRFSGPWECDDVQLQPTSDYCSWPHVGCDADRHVQNLTLVGLGLAGSLPTSLGALGVLTSLQLHNNPRMRGTVPTQLGLLSSLLRMDLSNTALSGQ